MGLPELKARIVAQLEAVAGIGHVYDHLAFANTEAEQNAKLISNGALNVWMVTREAMPLADVSDGGAVTERHPKMLVQGFYSLDEAAGSEVIFDGLIDLVIAALNADRRQRSNFGGNVLQADPPQLRVSDHRVYGPTGTLCHHCEIGVDTLIDFLE